MSKSFELPEHIQEIIASMPEYKYGVNLVTVTLDDGKEIPDVYVAWAKEVVKVGNSEAIPFDPSRVVSARSQIT